MTYEDAVDYIRCATGAGCFQICNAKYRGECTDDKVIEAVNIVTEEFQKADKYAWHDLLKDPTDLPTKRDWVLAVFKEPDCDFVLVPRVADYVGYETSATTDEFWLIIDVLTEDMDDYYKSLKCIAWKEIEPFEEDV